MNVIYRKIDFFDKNLSFSLPVSENSTIMIFSLPNYIPFSPVLIVKPLI